MRIFALVCSLTCLISAGCAVCASPHDDTYAAFGGAWERDLENHGRVGSRFTQAGYRTLTETPSEPEPADASQSEGGAGENALQEISFEAPLPVASAYETHSAEDAGIIEATLIPTLESPEAGSPSDETAEGTDADPVADDPAEPALLRPAPLAE